MKKPSYYNMHKSSGIGLCKSADNSSRKEMDIMQKRTLKYALLGLLCHDNLSGYDLYLEFDKALSEFWSAKHSQIYPELKRLTEEGLVKFQVEISGNDEFSELCRDVEEMRVRLKESAEEKLLLDTKNNKIQASAVNLFPFL